jgi:hypothetical protein
MADDDRYRWLNDEAVERLLRGSTVNARSTRRGGRHAAGHNNVEAAPTSAYGRPAAATPSWARGSETPGSVPDQRTREALAEERLAALLDTLVAEQTATLQALGAARTGTVPGEAGAELPGEAAAVEAFRAAFPQAVAEHAGTVDITAGPTESGTVVGRRAARENRRRSRDRHRGTAGRASLMGRPLRAGFAMAVAGCAIGGVAVATGAGVLPTPFGGGDSPAASVSPLASPGDERDEAAGGSGSPYDGSPRRGTREGGSPSDSQSGEDLAGKERGRDANNSNGRKGNEDWWHANGKGLSESDKKAMARALCEAYEKDDLSLNDRLRLELVAGGSDGVKKFCDKHDSGRDGSTASGGVGAPENQEGDSGGSSSGKDDGDDGGGGDHDDGGSGYDGGESGGDSGDGSGGSRPDGGDQQTSEGLSTGSDSPSPSGSASPSPDAGATAGS